MKTIEYIERNEWEGETWTTFMKVTDEEYELSMSIQEHINQVVESVDEEPEYFSYQFKEYTKPFPTEEDIKGMIEIDFYENGGECMCEEDDLESDACDCMFNHGYFPSHIVDKLPNKKLQKLLDLLNKETTADKKLKLLDEFLYKQKIFLDDKDFNRKYGKL